MLSHHNVSSLCLMAMLLPFWPNVLMAEVGPKEQCDGAAIIWPTEDHYGSIYISRDLRDGSFPRLGYLPSGTVVTLDEPYADSKDGFKKQHCGFRFRDAIVGQIDRRHITKLTGTLRSANLNDSDAVIIAPSNPNSEKSLFLHEGKDSDSKVIKQVSRGDRIIILASLRDLRDTSDTIKVRYTDDILSRSPEFAEAYVRREDNRTFGYDGTFRTFSPFVPSESTSSEQDRNSWFGSLKKYLSAFIAPGKKISELFDGLKNYAGTGACGRSETIKLALETHVAAEVKIAGITVKGEGVIEWKKPEDKASQFATFGPNKDFAVTVSGTAHCAGVDPDYLEEAHIIVGDPADDNRGFAVVRDEFFEVFSEDPTTKRLKSLSSRVNSGRDIVLGLTQMMVVPPMSAESGFYYTYFDRLEKFMYDNVFLKPLPLDEEDKYALTLLVGEVLTYWQPPKTPIFRGRKTS